MRVQEHLTKSTPCSEETVCSVKGLTGSYIDHLDVTVRQGECLAVQSLDEKVSKELLEMLEGREKPVSGTLLLEGKPVGAGDRRKIAVISPQPWASMIFEELSIYDNLCIGMDHRVPAVWSSRGIYKSICSTVEEQMGAGFMDMQVQELTIQQKSELVYTRILFQRPKIVFCIQPFKGADLSHRLLIWELQKRLLDRGIAVVIIAVNMADALSIADRVVRIDKHTRVETYERSEFANLPPTVPWYSLYQGMDHTFEKEIEKDNV